MIYMCACVNTYCMWPTPKSVFLLASWSEIKLEACWWVMFVKCQITVKYRLLFIIDFINWRYHPYVGGHYQMSGIIWIARWQLPDYFPTYIYIYIYSFYPSRLSAPISSAVSWRWYFLVRPNQHRRIYKLRLMKQNKRNMPHRAAHTHLWSVDRGGAKPLRR